MGIYEFDLETRIGLEALKSLEYKTAIIERSLSL